MNKETQKEKGNKVLEKRAQLLKVLDQAIKVENDGYHFYQAAAARTRDAKGKATFRSLAQDELDHASMLKGLRQAVKEESEFRFSLKPHPKKLAVRSKSPIFSTEFRRKLKDDHFELSALRIGQLLERNSMEFYGRHAKTARHQELKSLYRYLVQWEKDHLRALVQQERYLKGKF